MKADRSYFRSQVLSGIPPHIFNDFALELFRFQAENNPVYAEFIKLLGKKTDNISNINEIPFLPISFFKTHDVICHGLNPAEIFTSSGTTGTNTSRHLVADIDLYLLNARNNFSSFYGDPSGHIFLALLPGYLERKGSSLIRMIDYFISISEGGFFLYNHDALAEKIKFYSGTKKNIILIGVTHALLDLAESSVLNEIDTSGLIIMETGGMKGRRIELIREELHEILSRSFGTTSIHSEYGMTELFSQAYSMAGGKFQCPDTMKILIREITDPFNILPAGKSGAINIIDLANIDSVSFIATDDLGKSDAHGNFEVLGRTDTSDIRGCNLMIS